MAVWSLAWVVCPPAMARDGAFRSQVNLAVRAARQVAPQLGVLVYDLAAGQEVYSFNPGTLRIVASNTKLFTTAAALDGLGPGFFFETDIWAEGQVQGDSLQGSLAVIGGGDPNLSGRQYFGDSYGAFRLWAAALRRQGITRITGDLILVDGLFDRQWVHPDWPRDQLTRWYEAPVSSLSFNDNCVLVRVESAGRPGAPAMVNTTPPLPLFQVRSTARITTQQQGLKVDRSGPTLLTVAGQIRQGAEPYDKWVTVADPVAYFGAALRQAFAEEGIEIAGGTRTLARRPPGDWRQVHVHRTDLLTVLQVVNKRSQNFYAESVLKLLGERLCGEGSWAAGLRAVAGFLEGVGISAGSYRQADGSGMSRNNRFSPQQVIRLLDHMYDHAWSSEYLQTLPFSGEPDLRWEERLSEAPYQGNVIAKTGYLSGVSSLSGYLKARSGTVYAFSILGNGIRSRAAANSAEDRIVRAIFDHG